MPSALTVRFRPAGLWRIGPDNGARTRTDRVFHSDSLFSALTLAMSDLGWVDEWIAATAESQVPAVRLSSCFPFSQNGLLIQPPRTVWPPSQTGKVRWKAARFVPLSLVSTLLKDEDLKEEQWAVDPVSECLVPVNRHGAAPPPFRVVMRSTSAVDRVSGASESSDTVAALQFAPGAGLWFVAVFEDDAARETWEPRLRSAAILLADSGVGGGRSRGWGRSRRPHFERGEWPALVGGRRADEGETAWWMVSLFSPSESDQVDWNRGNYSIVVRAGRVESRSAWGDLKPASRLVAEGSVLLSGAPPSGTARNVSPAELPHPVYRSGIGLAVPIPWREAQRFSLTEPRAVSTVAVEEAAEPGVPDVTQVEPCAGDVEAEELAAAELIGSTPEVPAPSEVPAPEPSEVPAPSPSEVPAPEPSEVPAPEPSEVPAPEPSEVPAPEPSEVPEPGEPERPQQMAQANEGDPREPEPPPVEEPPQPEEPPVQDPPARPDEGEPRA